MAHSRSDSLDSTSSLGSSLGSVTSRGSIEFYEALKQTRIAIEQSGIPLQNLVADAETIINTKFAPCPQSTLTYKIHSEKTISVSLASVMSAMLSCAEECGGARGKRYVASAIISCTKQTDKVVVEALADLGLTWLTHLLFIFKTSRSHKIQRNKNPSEVATPTAEITRGHVLEGAGAHRPGTFRDDVMERDGYACVITGWRDVSHPALDNHTGYYLDTAHILRRTISKFDKDRKSSSFKSAVTTFDMLVNFTRLSLKTVEDLKDNIDDVSNGMLLEGNSLKGFDAFSWCLKKTEAPNIYAVKIFRKISVCATDGQLVTFKDRSNDFQAEPEAGSYSTRKRSRPLDVPNPDYIAIHAAIAGILHMSGAGKFFDELLDKYDNHGRTAAPIESWQDLEKRMEEQALRDAVAEALRPVKVV